MEPVVKLNSEMSCARLVVQQTEPSLSAVQSERQVRGQNRHLPIRPVGLPRPSVVPEESLRTIQYRHSEIIRRTLRSRRPPTCLACLIVTTPPSTELTRKRFSDATNPTNATRNNQSLG